MRVLGWTFVLLLVAFPVALVAVAFMAFEDQPLVRRPADFTPAHVDRAKRILQQNDPRRMAPGAQRSVALSQEEVDLVLNYLATRYGRGGARVVLRPGMAVMSASVEIPGNPLGRYLNVDTQLRETAGLPEFDSLRVGRVPVPSWLGNWLLAQAARHVADNEQLRAVSDSVRAVNVADGRLSVTYLWRPEVLDSIRALVLPKDEQERLKAYQEELASITAKANTNVSLMDLMTPMFKLAERRAAGGDAVAENRAAIVTLTLYVNGRGLGAILPASKEWPQPQRRKVSLDRRDDFPKHFMVSAAIAATAGGPLSDAIGLQKEVDDSRGGSGFSFNDIAADRAGTRFGEVAVRNASSAAKLQRKLATGATESEIMPAVRDLPEFMPEAEFKRRFGGIGAPAYQRMMDDIEKRISALAMYR